MWRPKLEPAYKWVTWTEVIIHIHTFDLGNRVKTELGAFPSMLSNHQTPLALWFILEDVMDVNLHFEFYQVSYQHATESLNILYAWPCYSPASGGKTISMICIPTPCDFMNTLDHITFQISWTKQYQKNDTMYALGIYKWWERLWLLKAFPNLRYNLTLSALWIL